MRTATSCPTAKQTSTLRKSPGVPGSKLRGVIRGCGRFLPLLQYGSVMNTSGTLIDVFGVSKQKLTCTTWPPWYLSYSCACPERRHRLHILCMSENLDLLKNKCLTRILLPVGRLMLIGKYYRNLKSSYICSCERLEKMRIKLSQGESSNAASPTTVGQTHIWLLEGRDW